MIVAGTNPHRFSYNGKELDESLDLDRYYYGARYYDPELGRFTSPDPISDDWTPYSYVRNNPIMNNDPTGMTVCLRVLRHRHCGRLFGVDVLSL